MGEWVEEHPHRDKEEGEKGDEMEACGGVTGKREGNYLKYKQIIKKYKKIKARTKSLCPDMLNIPEPQACPAVVDIPSVIHSTVGN